MEHVTHIDARRLRAISLFAASKDVRYYLCGVCVEWLPDGRPLLVATNGHLLGAVPGAPNDGNFRVPRPSDFPETVILDELKLRAALQMHAMLGPKSAEEPIVLVTRGDRTAIELQVPSPGGCSTLSACGIDGSFPEWRRVAPASATLTGAAVTVDAEYLALYATASKLLGHKYRHVGLRAGGDGGPVVVTMAYEPEFYGVLMQCRGDTPSDPAWLRAPAVAPAAVKVKAKARAKRRAAA